MSEIKIPPTPPALEGVAHLASFVASFRFFLDNEKRLSAPLSRQCAAMRIFAALDTAEQSKSEVIVLRDDDHNLLCELLESSEICFIPPLAASREEGGEPEPITLPPIFERGYLGAIFASRPPKAV